MNMFFIPPLAGLSSNPDRSTGIPQSSCYAVNLMIRRITSTFSLTRIAI